MQKLCKTPVGGWLYEGGLAVRAKATSGNSKFQSPGQLRTDSVPGQLVCILTPSALGGKWFEVARVYVCVCVCVCVCV